MITQETVGNNFEIMLSLGPERLFDLRSAWPTSMSVKIFQSQSQSRLARTTATIPQRRLGPRRENNEYGAKRNLNLRGAALRGLHGRRRKKSAQMVSVALTLTSRTPAAGTPWRTRGGARCRQECRWSRLPCAAWGPQPSA